MNANLKYYLAGIPALLVTGVTLFLLLAAVSNAAASQPGDLLYSLRAPALQLQLSLTNDPVKRAEIELQLTPTTKQDPAIVPSVPSIVMPQVDVDKNTGANTNLDLNDDKDFDNNKNSNSGEPEDHPKVQPDDMDKNKNKPTTTTPLPSQPSGTDDKGGNNKEHDDKGGDDKGGDDKGADDKGSASTESEVHH